MLAALLIIIWFFISFFAATAEMQERGEEGAMLTDDIINQAQGLLAQQSEVFGSFCHTCENPFHLHVEAVRD